MSKEYDMSLYKHAVKVAIESEEMKKLEQVLEPEVKDLRAMAALLFGGEE